MTLITCPECSAEMSDQAAACPKCGRSNAPRAGGTPAIRTFAGKMKATATLLVVLAVIATVSGFWWGPALFLPGIVLFMFGMAA